MMPDMWLNFPMYVGNAFFAQTFCGVCSSVICFTSSTISGLALTSILALLVQDWRTESPWSAFLKANRTPNVDHVQGYHRGHRSFYRSLCQQSSDSDFVLLRQLSVPGRICPVPTVLWVAKVQFHHSSWHWWRFCMVDRLGHRTSWRWSLPSPLLPDEVIGEIFLLSVGWVIGHTPCNPIPNSSNLLPGDGEVHWIDAKCISLYWRVAPNSWPRVCQASKALCYQ